MAANQKLAAVSKGVLLGLEKGRTKNVDPDVLRDLAALYELPYEELVRRFVEHRYGLTRRDLVRHSEDQTSNLPTEGGSPDVPASVSRSLVSEVVELRNRVARYEALVDPLQDVASRLVKMARDSKKIRQAVGRRSSRG